MSSSTAAAGGGGAVPVTKSLALATQFISSYYQTLANETDSLYTFYDDDSEVVRVAEEQEGQFQDHETFVGQLSIHNVTLSLGFEKCKVKIETLDCMSSTNDSLIVVVTGLMVLAADVNLPRAFAQTFLLVRAASEDPDEPTHYYIRNDIMRFLARLPAVATGAAPAAAPAAAVTVATAAATQLQHSSEEQHLPRSPLVAPRSPALHVPSAVAAVHTLSPNKSPSALRTQSPAVPSYDLDASVAPLSQHVSHVDATNEYVSEEPQTQEEQAQEQELDQQQVDAQSAEFAAQAGVEETREETMVPDVQEADAAVEDSVAVEESVPVAVAAPIDAAAPAAAAPAAAAPVAIASAPTSAPTRAPAAPAKPVSWASRLSSLVRPAEPAVPKPAPVATSNSHHSNSPQSAASSSSSSSSHASAKAHAHTAKQNASSHAAISPFAPALPGTTLASASPAASAVAAAALAAAAASISDASKKVHTPVLTVDDFTVELEPSEADTDAEFRRVSRFRQRANGPRQPQQQQQQQHQQQQQYQQGGQRPSQASPSGDRPQRGHFTGRSQRGASDRPAGDRGGRPLRGRGGATGPAAAATAH